MAKKKSKQSKVSKTIKRKAKSTGKRLLISLVSLIILAILAYFGYVEVLKDDNNTSSDIASSLESTSDENPTSSLESSNDENSSFDSLYPIIEDEQFKAYFLELGNGYTGDATFIKVGDIDILIDAGSRKGSDKTLCDSINTWCDDNKLEYVIATHAHQDHIAGFVGTKANGGIFDNFECETIIDFAMTDSTTSIYNEYVEKLNIEVANGAKHYTALQCYNNEDGAQRDYDLGNNVTMSILYNYYYENSASKTEGGENNYSVCVLFTHQDNHYLFTGDLEEEGEEKLVEYNTLPKCQLFKGGHHGSYTASSDALLSVIKPEVVCVCCCAGSTEYTSNINNTFPAQDFINRIAAYTDRVYVTTMAVEDGYQSMNGIITFVSDGINYSVSGSNNDTKLKDSEWFKANRVWPEKESV